MRSSVVHNSIDCAETLAGVAGVAANDEVGKYDPASETLPTASVVIAFVNEEFYTLMRTVWAVLQETPPHLLHEVSSVGNA